MSVKIIKSVKLMSVNDKALKNIGQFQFSGISDLRLVDNCLKMTAYDAFDGNELKTVIIPRYLNNLLFVVCLAYSCFNYSLRRKLVFTVRKLKNFLETLERE